jgi:ferrous iron transport protein B
VALNLIDEAERKGIRIDHRRFARDIGVPVVPTVGKTGEGLARLVQAIADVSTGALKTSPRRLRSNARFQEAVDQLLPLVRELYPDLPNARWVAMRLLDGDERVRAAILSGELSEIAAGREFAASGQREVALNGTGS